MNIIKKYQIKAKKSLGQNFLVDNEKLDIISNTLDLFGKNIVEVGPGYGALTEKLLEKNPKKLELIEIDREMIDILEKRLLEKDLVIGETDFSIKNIDVLKYKPNLENYDVVANIPYYITSPILRHFFYDVEYTPQNMLILMQKDVGDKILEGNLNLNPSPLKEREIATKNSPSPHKGEGVRGGGKKKKFKNSVLSLFLQKKSFIREVLFVGRDSFSPSPKVDSSVLLFEKHNLYDEVDDEKFLEFIKLAFAENRKKLSKNLAKKYKKEDILRVFAENNIEENSRAENLDIALYCKLIGVFNNILT